MSNQLQIAVVGAHLNGQPLNHQLTTAARSRCRRLRPRRATGCSHSRPNHRSPAWCGSAPTTRAGGAIDVEVWELDAASFGDFVAQVPAPMCIGQVTLADGADVRGFLLRTDRGRGAAEITHFGGWRRRPLPPALTERDLSSCPRRSDERDAERRAIRRLATRSAP